MKILHGRRSQPTGEKERGMGIWNVRDFSRVAERSLQGVNWRQGVVALSSLYALRTISGVLRLRDRHSPSHTCQTVTQSSWAATELLRNVVGH